MLTEELREEASQTVGYLTGQGVTIKVLSGDAPRAVAAIAQRAGIPASFAVQLPPAGVLLQVAGLVLAAIAGLTLWRRLRPPA